MEDNGAAFGIPEHVLDAIAGDVFSMLLTASRALVPAELAAMTGLDLGLVVDACKALQEREYIAPSYMGVAGEPFETWPFTANIDQYCAIGVKVLPHSLVGVLTNLRAVEYDSYTESLVNSDADSVVKGIANVVAQLRSRAIEEIENPPRILGLGVEIGGHVKSNDGVVTLSPHLGWTRPVNLGTRVSDATVLPTIIENDVNALTVHQYMFGHGRGTQWFGVILVSDGIGCGFVLDGVLARGSSGAAGELGHIAVGGRRRKCLCGRSGCLETVSSERAIVNSVRGKHRAVQDIAEAAALGDAGDPTVLEIFSKAGEALGGAMAVLLNILNLEKVLIAIPHALSNFSRGSRIAFEHSLRRRISQQTFSTSGSGCEIVLDHLPDLCGAAGSASVVIQGFAGDPLKWKSQTAIPR